MHFERVHVEMKEHVPNGNWLCPDGGSILQCGASNSAQERQRPEQPKNRAAAQDIAYTQMLLLCGCPMHIEGLRPKDGPRDSSSTA